MNILTRPNPFQVMTDKANSLGYGNFDLNVTYALEQLERLVFEMVNVSKIKPKNSLQIKMREIAHYVITHSSCYQNAKEDIYINSQLSGISIPVIFMKDGGVIVLLKSLGTETKSGTSKKVNEALRIVFPQESYREMRVDKVATGSIHPRMKSDKKIVENEQRMMLRLKELGQNKNIVRYFFSMHYVHKRSKEQRMKIVMEYCSGGDLNTYFEKGYPNEDDLILIAKNILEGVDFLHTNNIFHSDLKPSNILLVENEYEEIIGAKIGDFGCSRDLRDPEQRFYLSGDGAYDSPELQKLKERMTQHLALQLTTEMDNLKFAEEHKNAFLKSYEESKKDKKIALKSEQADGDVYQKCKMGWEEAEVKYQEAVIKYKEKAESLVEVGRATLFAIDEAILKSDIFAVGLIFEQLFQKESKQLTPEMKELISLMKKENLVDRPSAKEALEAFKILDENKKLFIPDEVFLESEYED